ncbi:MAG: ribonuclease D [Thermoguttaceae bacterium]
MSLISTTTELRNLIDELHDSSVIAYDTEFISEGKYAPQLCLVQIASENRLALIDSLAIDNLDPLWDFFCRGTAEIVVHAGRSEMEFCHHAVKKLPPRLFDVQLAAGFLETDYPVGFGILVERVLGVSLPKGETRTAWNNRPLSAAQEEYAKNDVRYLAQLAKELEARLRKANQFEWYLEEMERSKKNLQNDFESPRWRKLPKLAGLKPRELAIVREVWLWRDDWARNANIPASRLLRDDLIVEIAKQGDPNRISSIRGLQRSDMNRILPHLTAAVQKGVKLSISECPEKIDSRTSSQYAVLTQFLFAALSAIGHQKHISQLLLGGPNDVRDWIASELGEKPSNRIPRLKEGWRAELIGSTLSDLLHGKRRLRLNSKKPENPIVFE